MARPHNIHTKATWHRVPVGVEMTVPQVAEWAGVSPRYILLMIRGERPCFPFPHNVEIRNVTPATSQYFLIRLPHEDAPEPEPHADEADWTE